MNNSKMYLYQYSLRLHLYTFPRPIWATSLFLFSSLRILKVMLDSFSKVVVGPTRGR